MKRNQKFRFGMDRIRVKKEDKQHKSRFSLRENKGQMRGIKHIRQNP